METIELLDKDRNKVCDIYPMEKDHRAQIIFDNNRIHLEVISPPDTALYGDKEDGDPNVFDWDQVGECIATLADYADQGYQIDDSVITAIGGVPLSAVRLICGTVSLDSDGDGPHRFGFYRGLNKGYGSHVFITIDDYLPRRYAKYPQK